MTEERKAHKEYFDKSAARALGRQIKSVERSFDTAAFERRATRKLSSLEFNDRIKQFASALNDTLDKSAPRMLDVITRSLPEPLPDCESVTDGFLQWPIGQFIADYGTDHVDESMTAMIELTQRFSSEYAVRPFVEQDPEAMVKRLAALADHKSPHVRRWCSEGLRPRLPWGRKLTAFVDDPTPLLPVLERLKSDPELYVRRSVGNCLNDIARDNPEVVVKTLRAWSKGASPETQWTIEHGLRSLIKDGHPGALRIAGFAPPKSIKATLSCTPAKIRIGESVALELKLSNTGSRAQKLLVDYVVHYVRGRGKISEKVFKWRRVELAKGESASLSKKHAMKKTTIRALYPGTHVVELQVNGERLAKTKFNLQSD